MSDPNKKEIFSHETVEKKVSWLGVWIVAVIAVGGLVEIVPLYLSNEVTTPAPGEGISIVALSDSSVMSDCSLATASPGLTSTSITSTSLKSPMSGTLTSSEAI